jgi:molybdopterin-containing oxidoreductase family iron-sulfur binding subunit
MSDKKYWQSFAELNDEESFQKMSADEFREELPFEGFDDKGLADAKAPRRDFLKYLGFSTAAAAIAAGCKTPVKKAIPYANKPENLVSGEAKYYATTYVQDGDVVPVVAKVRDGRPIKIEGNEMCSYTGGGTSARAQASVLDLYDTNRVRFPKHNVNGKFEEVPTWEQFDKMVADALAGLNGASVVLLTSTIVSPTSKLVIQEFINKFNGRHVEYDADSCSGALLANEAMFGTKALPTYHFDKAKTIVSLGADFLGSWGDIVANARQYAVGRKIDEKNPTMSRHYQFESFLSMTGANADVRYTHRPSEAGHVALALLAAVGGGVTAPSLEAKLQKGIETTAAELKANNGASVVVSGSNDMNVQVIVNAINHAIGAYGSTIDWAVKNHTRKGTEAEMDTLIADMEAGKIGAIFILGANPAYNYKAADKFKTALKKVKTSVSFNDRMDETTELCTHIAPTHHYLESWGDAEPKTGFVSFIQPTISPLFKTRQYQDSLMKWAGITSTYEAEVRKFWTTAGGTDFDTALQNGVMETAAAPSAGAYNGGAVATAAAAIGGAAKASGTELVLYQKVSLGTGAQAGNPWLQELPDPISKATWGNYALISVPLADKLGIKYKSNKYEYWMDKPVLKITGGGKSVSIPCLVIPGMNADTVAVAVGYGRNENFSKASAGMGVNIYPLAGATTVTVEKTGGEEKVAQMQIHNYYEDRHEVVRETTLATLKKYPHEISGYREHLAEDFAKMTKDYRSEATLYPMHSQPGIKWGMNIDMNSCTACGACVVACHAENNVPVVGKREVIRYHDMHWLRLDRYFVTDPNNPDDLKGVVFQPMLCQHCDNAPCENVCPVAATNHSSEGINQMTYNRCIGTRYCANNCPYKVRRFNWQDYTGADSFPDNQDQQLVGKLDEAVFQMNDDLTRMVLNPDVTVRSRGVIEKCSFCVQKLQAAKLTAKKENRVLADGDAKTACQTACSTNAIVFGNAYDTASAVSKARTDNKGRMFYVIEQIHTLPNVSYLAKVRNTDEVIEPKHPVAVHEENKGGHKAEEKKEAAPAAH